MTVKLWREGRLTVPVCLPGDLLHLLSKEEWRQQTSKKPVGSQQHVNTTGLNTVCFQVNRFYLFRSHLNKTKSFFELSIIQNVDAKLKKFLWTNRFNLSDYFRVPDSEQFSCIQKGQIMQKDSPPGFKSALPHLQQLFNCLEKTKCLLLAGVLLVKLITQAKLTTILTHCPQGMKLPSLLTVNVWIKFRPSGSTACMNLQPLACPLHQPGWLHSAQC